MPPKKETPAGADLNALSGFDGKETKILAAAFVASIGTGKIDYDLMEKLTGNTAGTLKKMWPPVKRKAVEQHPSFGPFVGMTSEGEAAKPAAAPKANGGRKRKAAQADSENNSVDGNTGVAADKAKPKKQAPKKAKKGKDDAGAEEADGNGVSKDEDIDEI